MNCPGDDRRGTFPDRRPEGSSQDKYPGICRFNFAMASFYLSNVERFLHQSSEILLAKLATSYAGGGYTSQYTEQTLTWQRDLEHLQELLKRCVDHCERANRWGVISNLRYRERHAGLT